MNQRNLNIGFILLLLITYFLVFYSVLSYPNTVDFTSFYSALLSLGNHENPYGQLWSDFLPFTKKLTPNLNPPIVLWLFMPLASFSYYSALISWLVLSSVLGLIGVSIAFYYAFSQRFIKKYWHILLMLYFSFFPTIINTLLAQLGFFLLFFLMLGYHFFIGNRNFLAGVLWGTIVAIKLFPALLFFYVVKQGRMTVFFTMLASFLLLSLIPFVIYGPEIYLNYFVIMKHVFWYGDNWNASIYGYLFRLFYSTSKQYLEIIYAFLIFLLVIGYYYNLGANKGNQFNHQPFCLSLTMMLLISPFGWLYYFPLIIFPLSLSLAIAMKENKINAVLLWLLCLFLINLPQNYVYIKNMQNFAIRFIFSSFYFYGLLLCNYLLMQTKFLPGKNNLIFNHRSIIFLLTIFFISLFAIIVTSINMSQSFHLFF